MATDRKQIRSYVDNDTKEKFTKICKEENRSESNMIEFLIKRYIKEYETQQERAAAKTNLNLEKSSDSRTG